MKYSPLKLLSSSGKYRTLITAVALFVLLDLGILAMNFVIASGLTENAVAVNLAGRQRMLSQRIAKATLQLENALQSGHTPRPALDELTMARALFDRTLLAFSKGGTTSSGASEEVTLHAVKSQRARHSIEAASALWNPLNHELLQLLQTPEDTITLATVLKAQSLAAQHNMALLTHMNTLTTDLESAARHQANVLRAVQTGGIVLALLNFCLILFHFIREMRAADERTEAARQETDEILHTVADGLFLLDKQFVIGSQYSQALKSLLSTEEPAGQSLLSLLEKRITKSDLTLAEDFIRLLFTDHVNERLISSLNPLQEVRIENDNASPRYLSFNFKRVLDQGLLSHLLVTVNDVTARVELTRRNLSQQDEASLQLDLIAVLLRSDKDQLDDCLQHSRKLLESINQRLRNANRNGMDDMLAASLARGLHTLKGEAGCLGLTQLEKRVHDAETELNKLRHTPGAGNGDRCLPLLVRIEQLFTAIEQIEQLATRIQVMQRQILITHTEKLPETPPPLAWNDLAALAQRAAQDTGKRIMLHWEPATLDHIPAGYTPWLKRIAVQLVRNAIVHGIESPAAREEKGKAAVGTVRILAKIEHDGKFLFSVRDDGGGLDIQAIRQKALSKNLINEAEAESLSNIRVLSLIFESGFSTVTPSLHAGRGIGLDMVRTIARSLGGRLRVSTRKNGFCEISLVLPAMADQTQPEPRHALADC